MLPVLSDVAKRLVLEAVVEKKFVVVALVLVELLAVKLARVVEALTMRLVVVAWPKMVKPEEVVPPPIVEEAFDWKPVSIPREVREDPVTLEARVAPVRLAAGTVPVKEPEKEPKVALLAKRLVEEARPEIYRLVEVALVVVELMPVKFCSVVEPLERIFEKVPRPVEVMFPAEVIA